MSRGITRSLKIDQGEEQVTNSVEVTIGRRLRSRREALGLSQEDLARILGIASQQVHKYESGSNRISASRLAEVADLLGVGLRYFFDPEVNDGSEDTTEPTAELLVRYYEQITDVERKRLLLRLTVRLSRRSEEH